MDGQLYFYDTCTVSEVNGGVNKVHENDGRNLELNTITATASLDLETHMDFFLTREGRQMNKLPLNSEPEFIHSGCSVKVWNFLSDSSKED